MRDLTPEQIIEVRARLTKTVREMAQSQSNSANRENYFNSCIKHGGTLGEVAIEVKKEFN